MLLICMKMPLKLPVNIIWKEKVQSGIKNKNIFIHISKNVFFFFMTKGNSTIVNKNISLLQCLITQIKENIMNYLWINISHTLNLTSILCLFLDSENVQLPDNFLLFLWEFTAYVTSKFHLDMSFVNFRIITVFKNLH